MAGPPPSSASTSILDQMPPSPALTGQAPGGLPSLSAFGPAWPAPTPGLPPEILSGVMQVGQQIGGLLDQLAQMMPDLGQDWQTVKQLLLQTLAKVATQSAGPTAATPTSPGMGPFPGGGLDRGQLPAPPSA